MFHIFDELMGFKTRRIMPINGWLGLVGILSVSTILFWRYKKRIKSKKKSELVNFIQECISKSKANGTQQTSQTRYRVVIPREKKGVITQKAQ